MSEPPAILAIDHVQVAAPPGCEDDARRFYGEVLGLAEVAKPEALQARGGVWFAVGATHQLHVGVEEGFAPARKAHPALRAEDPHALAATLERAGHEVRWDDAVPGRFFTDDPFGNRIEVVP